jgi:hypothetical protein
LERDFDLFQKMAMVLFDRPNVVGLFVDDLLGDVPLASHRIDRHHGPVQLQCIN